MTETSLYLKQQCTDDYEHTFKAMLWYSQKWQCGDAVIFSWILQGQCIVNMLPLVASHRTPLQHAEFLYSYYPLMGGQMITAQSLTLTTSPSSDCCLLSQFLFFVLM